MVKEAFGVDADVGAVAGGGGDQRGDIAHRVGGLLGRQIARIGAAPAGRLAGVGFHQRPGGTRLTLVPSPLAGDTRLVVVVLLRG